MNTMVRNLVVGGSLFVFFWVGCSDDEETEDEDGTTTVAASTGPTSTGTMATGTSVSTVAATTVSASTGPGMLYGCNPVTNEPCAAGEACDLSAMGTMACIAPPNEGAICDTCNQGNGPWCQGTMTCLGSGDQCRRYCCDDADCGPSLTCDKTILAADGFTEIGICEGMAGTGGAGGAGGGIPGCSDVPAVAPSNGSCVPFP